MSHVKFFVWAVSLILCFSVLTSISLAASSRTYQVQLRETSLRTTPSFLGKITATLRYGDRVMILQERGAWKKIAVSGTRREGWVHGSAITTKVLVLKSGTQSVKTGATSSEVALAGKGFSEQVEKEFKKKNKGLNFTWVDRMEAFKVSPTQIEAFLEEGSLHTSEGGAR